MPPMWTEPASFGLRRIADIVLAHLAGAPAGDVEKLVVHGQVDIGHQRRHCAKALQKRRQLVFRRGSGGIVAVFSM